MILDAALLNSQYYQVGIKGKEKQSREWSRVPPLHVSVVGTLRVNLDSDRQLYFRLFNHAIATSLVERKL